MPESKPGGGRTLNINGRDHVVHASPGRKLLSILRDDLDLTGTKYGCGEGQCGACTVLVDGSPIRSCTTAVETVAGKRIVTIEGLEQNGQLHPVQQAFLDADTLQCGYCTSGMIMSAVGLIRKNANPSDRDIRESLNGNICRCGTYPRIIAAVRMAARSGGAANGR
jgi:aerobic-type carbon monoxide dehydrogenase small subunit (CoxS/CutS family)